MAKRAQEADAGNESNMDGLKSNWGDAGGL